MRIFTTSVVLATLFASAAAAQQWEIAGEAGYGLYRNVTITSQAGSATGGFAPGFVFGAAITQNMGRYFGGEPRYRFASNDLKLSGAQEAHLGAQSHTFDYDVLVYAKPNGSRVRPFLAVGAGAKWYRGTGVESAYQPMSNIAVLTRTREWTPELNVGGGVKFLFGSRGLFRVDVRDSASPLPTDLVTPIPPTGRSSGWLHQLVVTAGIGLRFR